MMRPLLRLAGACLLQGEVPWTTYDGVSIPVPPAGRPRLYLRAQDIPDLQRRTTHPALKLVWEKLQAAAKNNPTLAVEVDAVRYLLSKDADLGAALRRRR